MIYIEDMFLGEIAQRAGRQETKEDEVKQWCNVKRESWSPDPRGALEHVECPPSSPQHTVRSSLSSRGQEAMVGHQHPEFPNGHGDSNSHGQSFEEG